MSGRTIPIKVRVSAENADAVKKALEGMGATGEAAMRKLDAAARASTPSAKALAAVSDDLKSGLSNVGQEIPGVSNALRSLGGVGTVVAGGLGLVAAAAAAGFAAAREYMTWAANLTDAADAVQTNVENMQAWRFAMEEVGGQASDLDAGLSGLNGTIGALKTGLGDAKAEAALLELGLDPEVVKSWDSLDQALPAIIKAFENVGTEAERVQIARRLNIEALLPLLRLGEEGFKSLEGSAKDLGQTLDADVVRALDEANRRLEISSARMRNEAAPAAVFFANALASIGDAAGISMAAVFRLIGSIDEAMRKKTTFDALKHMARETIDAVGDYAGVKNGPTKGGRGGGGGSSGLIDSVITDNARRNGVLAAAPPPPPLPRTPVRSAPVRLPPPPRSMAPVRASFPARALPSANAAREASDLIRAQAEAARRVEANAQAIERAQLDSLRAEEDMAETAEARRAIAQRIAETERAQALAAIQTDKAMDEETKAAQSVAVEKAFQAKLVAIANAQQAEINQARERQAQTEARLRDMIADAELSMLESSAEQVKTRGEALALELQILDLITQRRIDEIAASDASAEAKALAIAALNAARESRAEQTKTQHDSPLERYARDIKRERENINDAIENMAVSGLEDLEGQLLAIADGSKSAGDAFSDMAESILRDIAQLAIRQWLIAPLLGALGLNAGGMEGAGGAGGAGVGSAGAGWIGQLGNLFGGRNGGAGGSAGGLGSIFRGGAATGAYMRAGDMRIVGERGPEPFIADRAGMVLPSNAMGGDLKVIIHNAPSTPQVRRGADGSVDVIFERLNALEGSVSDLDRGFESRTARTMSEVRRRGVRI
jgi:hypothetical protein